MLCLKAEEYFRAMPLIEMEMWFSGCLSRGSALQPQTEAGVMKYPVFEARLRNRNPREMFMAFPFLH